jgi:hypothetical protein
MFTFKEAFKHYLFKVNTERLYDTLMMVIVCTSIKNIKFTPKQQGIYFWYYHFTFLAHLFHLCTKGGIFPIFPLLD